MRLRDLAIWSFSRLPPVAILDLIQPEMAPFAPPSPKTPPRTDMTGIGGRVAELWIFEIFAKCVNGPWGRSSGGRWSAGCQYSYFLHWSHILLFRYVRDVARAESSSLVPYSLVRTLAARQTKLLQPARSFVDCSNSSVDKWGVKNKIQKLSCCCEWSWVHTTNF